jgi:glutamyl-tRNA synthetase
MIRVRFAPSPTGYLHVGGARTALFNWLYARRHGGTFILRIEDTDAERSSWEMVTGIVDGMRWLGLDWDEGPDIGGPHAPYFQSERIGQYRAAAQRLVVEGRAYYCYCPPAELQQKRQAGEAAAGGWVYDRTCLALTSEEIARREAEQVPRAVRFKVPEGETAFTDLVRGDIRFANANLEDFVILRSDLQPTYHLSVVVDDMAMEITHVVRGDDHISNTPKQVLLYAAFGRPAPAFAHVPLIMGPDKKRLSKRHGATSVMEYARLGYLPEAMVNFLALLGWSPGSDEEVFTRDELVSRFTLEGISGGNAVFNPEKLDWFNQQHIARLPAGDLASRVKPLLEAAGLWDQALAGARAPWLARLLDLLKPRARKIEQIVEEARPFLEDVLSRDEAAAAKHLSNASLRAPMEALVEGLSRLDPFEPAGIEHVLRAAAESSGVKAGSLIHATRVAVTGRAVSPSLFETVELLGRERVIARLQLALAALPR